VAFADDFSDGPEEDPSPPLLPREDRIWRHPSELGAAEQPFVLDPALVRRRWLAHQPTRASAWTAGLVGALLATGLVVLGTHLAAAFTSAQRSSDLGTASAPPVAGEGSAPVSTVAFGPSELPVSDSVSAMIDRVAAATATIETSSNGRDGFADALVLSSGGDLVAPLSALDGATSVLVTPPGDATYVGNVVAIDENAGIAVIHVRDATGLRTAPFAASTPASGDLVFALGDAGGPLAWGATVLSVDGNSGHAGWPVALAADVPAGRALPGTPLVDSGGRVVAIVTGSAKVGVTAVPAWLAAPVAERLAATGRAAHGWLGLVCSNAFRHGRPVGALVQQVVGAPSIGALRPNDIVTSIDGTPVTSYLGLESRLYALAPGAPVELGVTRGAEKLSLDLRLGSG
jgi:S1-C subfamily serine protease